MSNKIKLSEVEGALVINWALAEDGEEYAAIDADGELVFSKYPFAKYVLGSWRSYDPSGKLAIRLTGQFYNIPKDYPNNRFTYTRNTITIDDVIYDLDDSVEPIENKETFHVSFEDSASERLLKIDNIMQILNKERAQALAEIAHLNWIEIPTWAKMCAINNNGKIEFIK